MPRLGIAVFALAACHGTISGVAPDGEPPPPPPPDAPSGPAKLVAVIAPTWLHEATRLVFDGPIDPLSLGGATAAVTLAGSPLSATLALDGDHAIAIAVDPSARGLGELVVHVAGAVRDTMGNAVDASAATSAMLGPWSSLPIDRGPAAQSPALAVTALGGVVAAWTVGAPGSRRVIVALLDRGAWQPLGDPLGADDATSASIALDDTGAPVVAWIDDGIAHVARWGGAAWSELSSPGAGSAVAIASRDMVVVAIFGANASMFQLAAGAWQQLGAGVPLGSFVGEPALAVADHARAAIGWIDNAATLHVARWRAGTWTELAQIALGVPPRGFDRVSLAARDDTIAVAWDQFGGSFGVLAAEVTGNATSWRRLGHALDVDVAGDAVAPAIALDATDHPIVAWTELIETAQRGVLARWNGTRWQLVGGVTWLDDPEVAPTRATLALGPGDTPVVGYASGGAIGAMRFDGPATADPGIASRAPLAGCTFSAAAPPALLSQTGCFTIATPGKPAPHPGLIPYDVIVELWTDGAKKRRWLALPDGGSLTTSSTGAFAPPVGSFVVKEFALETTPGDPSTRRAIETRVLVLDAGGWHGFSYRWRSDGTDAALQPDAEQTFAWPMDDGSTHVHFYPSRSDCVQCHQSTYGPLLGLRAPQLARWYDYGGTIADQLFTLSQLGVAPVATATPFASPHDPSQSWEVRARGYMASNCAHCHNPSDVAIHDLRYTTPLADTNLCPDIVPGDPSASKVYQLVASRPGMPPLGTLAVDPLAVQILGNWITQMTSCP